MALGSSSTSNPKRHNFCIKNHYKERKHFHQVILIYKNNFQKLLTSKCTPPVLISQFFHENKTYRREAEDKIDSRQTIGVLLHQKVHIIHTIIRRINKQLQNLPHPERHCPVLILTEIPMKKRKNEETPPACLLAAPT
jgi:hypothetical protein